MIIKNKRKKPFINARNIKRFSAKYNFLDTYILA
uniref:Uncharacterized protein n=1 Tax=Myoviridae sp. ctai52 TaxID=2825134 RepID=A0A8S5VFJ2_9CAUD|nr:MAG TPA: hypothetical protein [Myoviridae sp. ctai52]